MPDLAETIIDTADWLEAHGIKQAVVRRRDRREPGRREKEAAELRLQQVMQRIFRKQRALVRARLEMYYPTALKAITPDLLFDSDVDDDDRNDLISILRRAILGGIRLFGESVAVGIDYTITNSRAAQWARDYAYELIRGINEVSKRVVSQAVSSFVETPGMTVGDVIDLLPFSEGRAQSVAVTEITRAYAEGNRQAGQELKEQFPDLQVIKIWYTNNDDRVCPICGPLDGMEVGFDEFFTTDDDKSLGIDEPPAHPNCRCWTTFTTKV